MQRPLPRPGFPQHAWLFLTGLAVIAACKGDRAEPVVSEAQMPTTTAMRPTIELTNPGAKPHRTLRYRLVKGAQDTMDMQVGLTIATEADGVPLPVPHTPPVVMTMRLQITELHNAKRARYQFALESVEVEEDLEASPEATVRMRDALANAAGMSGHAMIDDRGFNWDARMNPPDRLTPEIQQMMESASRGMDQVSAPLPEQPVGIGATWSLRQEIEQGGVTLEQITHFELVALDGDTGTLRTQTTQKAVPQPMKIPGLPTGSAKLAAFSSTGSGRIHFDLDRLVPRSTLALRSDYEVRMEAEGEPEQVKTRIEMRIEVAPR